MWRQCIFMLYISRVSEFDRVTQRAWLKNKRQSGSWMPWRLCGLWTQSKTQSSAWKILRGRGRIFPPYQCAFLMKDSQEMPVLKCVVISGFSTTGTGLCLCRSHVNDSLYEHMKRVSTRWELLVSQSVLWSGFMVVQFTQLRDNQRPHQSPTFWYKMVLCHLILSCKMQIFYFLFFGFWNKLWNTNRDLHVIKTGL